MLNIWIALPLVLHVLASSYSASFAAGSNVAGMRSAAAPQVTAQSENAAYDQLKKENNELKTTVASYKKLEEDVVAQRIAETAENQVLWWLRLGGLAALVLGIVGYRAITDYGKKLVSAQVESLMKQRVESMLTDEVHHQVTVFMVAQREDFLMFARQQQDHLLASTEPLGAKDTTIAPAAVHLARIDYESQMGPVRDSGAEGSTVGFSAATALQFQIKKKLHQDVVISPRFIYYAARALDGSAAFDAGARIASVITVLKKQGAVPEEAWPYKPGDFAAEPPQAVKGAHHYKIKTAVRVSALDEIKSSLEEFGPLITGLSIYPSAMTDEARKTGHIPMPAPSEGVIGGHSLCLIGYDGDKKEFKAQNNWGPQWGDRGFAYVPYEYAERFFQETYAITLWMTRADLAAP